MFNKIVSSLVLVLFFPLEEMEWRDPEESLYDITVMCSIYIVMYMFQKNKIY